jgi:hypothetical protein
MDCLKAPLTIAVGSVTTFEASLISIEFCFCSPTRFDLLDPSNLWKLLVCCENPSHPLIAPSMCSNQSKTELSVRHRLFSLWLDTNLLFTWLMGNLAGILTKLLRLLDSTLWKVPQNLQIHTLSFF